MSVTVIVSSGSGVVFRVVSTTWRVPLRVAIFVRAFLNVVVRKDITTYIIVDSDCAV